MFSQTLDWIAAHPVVTGAALVVSLAVALIYGAIIYVAIGRMDVVMVAVDGGLTLDLPSVIRVMNRLKASIVIPMHWFGDGTLGAFLDGMREQFDVVPTEGSELTVSLERLPAQPTVMVLRPAFLREGE